MGPPEKHPVKAKVVSTEEEMRQLRGEVVFMRVEGPKVIGRIMEQARQQQMQNMKEAECIFSHVQKVEKKLDFWMPGLESFDIPEPQHSLEKQIELNAKVDELLETLKMLKESQKKE